MSRAQSAIEAGAPPGWSYNPSALSKRLPLVALAFVGFCIATYLTLYQLGVFASVWEPFFGDGSRKVLHSTLSRLLPVPDAALGAFGYAMDVVSGIIGGERRWRTMPWIVIFFGCIITLMAATSIMLVIFQPTLFDAWCTLCLCSALVSILLVILARDEPLASLEYLKRERARGRSLWQAFWKGDE